MNWSTFEAIDYNTHIAAYYPLYLFGWLKFCSAADAAQAADVIAVLHIGLFFLTTTSLIRTTGASIAPSIAGASFAATVPTVYCLAVFPTLIAALAWLPLAVEGLVRLYYRRQYAVGTALLTAGTGAILTAGPGSYLLSALVFVGLILTIHTGIGILRARETHFALRLTGAIFLAAAATALLCLGSTINLFSHIDEMIRWTRTGHVVGQASVGNPMEILAEKLRWRDLGQLLYPASFGAVGSYLLGPVLVALASVGLAAGWRNPIVRAFGVVAVVSVAVAFLLPGRIVMLWSFVPGLSHTRHLSIVATPLTLAMAVLAAHGIRALLEPGYPSRRTLLMMAAGSALLALLSATLNLTMPLKSSLAPQLLAALAVGGSGLVTLVLALKSSRARYYGVAALFAVHLVFVIGSFPKPAGTPSVSTSAIWHALELALNHIRKTDPQPGRVGFHSSIKTGAYGDGLTYITAGSIATYKDLATFSSYMSPRIYWKFLRDTFLEGENRFGFVGGKYLVAAAPVDASIGIPVFEQEGVWVYRLRDSHSLISAYCLSKPTVLQTTEAKGRLPKLEGEAAETVRQAQRKGSICEGNSTQSHLDRRNNAIDFFVGAAAGRLLVLNYPPYASWRLQVDGNDVPIYNLGDEQVIAFLPAELSGPAVLAYRPTASALRIWISKLSWFVLFSSFALLALIEAYSRFAPPFDTLRRTPRAT